MCNKNNNKPLTLVLRSGGVTCKLGALCFYSSSVVVDSEVLRNPPENVGKNLPQIGLQGWTFIDTKKIRVALFRDALKCAYEEISKKHRNK